MLRSIQIVPSIAEEATGPSYSVRRLCESLIDQKVESCIAALDWAPMQTVPSYLHRFPLGLGPRKLGRSPKMERWLDQQARSSSVDLMHNHSLWMMPNVYPGRVARRHQIPLVVSPRGTVSEWAMRYGSVTKQLFWPLWQRPALEAAACFHATALSEYEDIRRLGFRQPVAIIPNGIDLPVWREKTAAQKRTLLFLGRIHQKKGLDLLLPAWGCLQNRFPDWQLKIAGPDNGGYLAQMQVRAAELHLKRIELCGPLYGEQKWQAYQQAELFVLPTYSENFGMTVAEALAAGTPAIVSKGAPWEGLANKDAGWWIDIGLEPLVACMEEAMACSFERLQQMGVQGRSWMQKAYSWQGIGQQMAEAYRWILHGGERAEWVRVD